MDKEYLIHQKPIRALFTFALPMMLGNLFQQFYNMADSVVVGRFVGESALAAVGASYSLTNVFISIAIGGGVGASVVTSRYFGARDYEKMKLSVSTALLSFLAISILLGGVGLLCSQQIMRLLNTPLDILDTAVEYLNIYFTGLPFLFLYNVLSAMFNALGRSRIPLYLLIFSSIFNVLLDLFMVGTLHLGVAGAAWATLIAQGISAVISFLLFLRELRSYQSGKQRLFALGELRQMTSIALPSILQQSTVSIGMMLVQSVVNSFGVEMLAGFSAGMRVESICVVPMSAMGNAMSTYTAQNLGAKRGDRIKQGFRASATLVAIFAVILCVALQLCHSSVMSLFLGDDGTVLAIETGTSYLRFIGWFFALIGLKMTADGILRGSGHMLPFTAANLINLALRVAVAVTLAPLFGIGWVWYAVPIGWFINFLISYLAYRKNEASFSAA